MSVSTMMRLASQAQADEAHARGGRRRGPGQSANPAREPEKRPAIGDAHMTSASDPTSNVGTALETLTAFIPSEALASYIVGLGLFTPSSEGARWSLLAVGAICVIVFAVLAGLDRAVRPSPRKTIVVVILALIAFLVYAGALPGSPFQQINDQATVVFAFAAVILAFALPRVARILKVAPET